MPENSKDRLLFIHGNSKNNTLVVCLGFLSQKKPEVRPEVERAPSFSQLYYFNFNIMYNDILSNWLKQRLNRAGSGGKTKIRHAWCDVMKFGCLRRRLQS